MRPSAESRGTDRGAARSRPAPDHGNRDRGDIADHAEEITPVEFASLSGNIARWIMKPLERADPGLARFGDDLAGSVSGESIHHHAVEARQGTDLPGAFVEEGGQVDGLIEPRHHRAHGAGRIAMFVGCRLCFEDDLITGHVKPDIEASDLIHQSAVENALDRIRSTQHGQAIAEAVNRRRRKRLSETSAQHVLRSEGKEIADIRRDPADHPVGRERDQKSDRLDRTQNNGSALGRNS